MQRNILSIILVTAATVDASYVHPSTIPRGCARFYMSNPKETFKGMSEDGTQYWQVCGQLLRDKPAKVAIGAGVFSKIKDKFGMDTANSITFISTGADCWVDIFSGPKQTGETYGIAPLNDVDLKTIPLVNDPDHNSFNDNIVSGYIRGTDSTNENPDSNNFAPGVVPIACFYTFNALKPLPTDDDCAYFYDSDPTDTSSEGTNGFALCTSNNQHIAHVNQKDFRDRGFTRAIDGTIAYVAAGADVDAGVYEKDNWEGDKTIVLHKDSKYIHLESTKSILLISTVYAKSVTPAAMFAAAENFLHGKGSINDI